MKTTTQDLAASYLRDAMANIRAVRRYEAQSKAFGATLCTKEELTHHRCVVEARRLRAIARRLRSQA